MRQILYIIVTIIYNYQKKFQIMKLFYEIKVKSKRLVILFLAILVGIDKIIY